MSRVLCVCSNGNVRSITLARILKGRGHQVLVLGAKDFAESKYYIDIDVALDLCEWAEIIFCQKDSERYLVSIIDRTDKSPRGELLDKIDLRFDVGPDDWKVPMHPELLAKMRTLVESDLYWKINYSDVLM